METINDILEAFRPILDDEDFDKIPAQLDGEVLAYVEFSARFDHRTTSTRSSPTSRTPSAAPSGSRSIRMDASEAIVDEHWDDPEYLDPDLENGVRAQVTISRSDRFGLDVRPAHVVIDGDEIDAD